MEKEERLDASINIRMSVELREAAHAKASASGFTLSEILRILTEKWVSGELELRV